MRFGIDMVYKEGKQNNNIKLKKEYDVDSYISSGRYSLFRIIL